MNSLSPRQQAILNRVVDAYIDNGQPVGSRAITELYTTLYQDSYSAATVRHEMGRLEELGYLTHPHTSAGRIPTDRGYRYYVDHALQQEKLPQDWVQRLEREQMPSAEADVYFEKVAGVLSRLVEQVCVILAPDRPAPRGRRPVRFRLILQGSSFMLEKPEFRDVEKMRRILKGFEEKAGFVEWLHERSAHSGVSITIGRENGPEAFQDCAVVSAPCAIDDQPAGTFAVIGPRRMRYSRMVSLVQYMGRRVERALAESAQDF